MVLFELVHLVSGLGGVGAAVGLLGPWPEHAWSFTAAMWAAFVGVAGSGLILSLAWVGTGAQISAGLLLGKVVLTVALLLVMYQTLSGLDENSPPESQPRLLAMLFLWIAAFILGVVLV